MVFFVFNVNERLMHCLKIFAHLCLRLTNGGNTHQTLDLQTGQLGRFFQQLRQCLDHNAAFAFLPADVHLHQYPGGHAVLNGLLGNLLGQFHRIHRLDHIHLTHNILNLIGLESTDQVLFHPIQVQLVPLAQVFLHPILADQIGAQIQRPVNVHRLHGLGHCHQANISGIAAAFDGALLHPI